MTEQISKRTALSISGNLDIEAQEVELLLADGRVIRLPTALLLQAMQAEGPLSLTSPNEETILVPLIEEQLQVTRRVVETGKVLLQKTAEAYDVKLDEPLAVETWQVERVAKHEVVEQTPLSRQEGQTTVYPIVEERLILTKELVLIEEVRVTRTITERRDTRTVTLYREKMSMEKRPAINSSQAAQPVSI